MKKKTVAIIPARAGSKRLPGKNYKALFGSPLIEHSINYAKENEHLIDDIIVTTDDNKIKEIALKNNVKVVNRPKSLSGDNATTVSALKHVIENIDTEYDNIVLLQPTNPLRPKELLSKAFEVFDEKYDSLFTVSQCHQKLGKIINEKYVPYNYKMGQRSQDMDPLYFENGLLYIIKREVVLSNKIMGDNCKPFIVDHFYSGIDIDTEDDFKLAEFACNYFNL